jgi:hypothetical protein
LRRKAKSPRIGRTTGDIKRDLSKDQLAGIGAVAMAWNSAESFVDLLLTIALGLDTSLASDLTDRVGAFDAKSVLINQASVKRLRLDHELFDLTETLGVAKECKTNRDGVIHAQLYNADKGLGILYKREGQYDVLLSQEALDSLYARLIAIRDELRIIVFILTTLNEALREDASADLERLQCEPAVQGYVSQLREHQKARRSLPPLPKFPE